MDRVDLRLKFKGVHHRGKSLIFEVNGNTCYLSKKLVILRDPTNNRPIDWMKTGQMVIVNIPKGYALKVGLLLEEMS